jgi:hypothetical protein
MTCYIAATMREYKVGDHLLVGWGADFGYVASILGNLPQICAKHYSKWIVERQHAVDKAVRASWKAENVGHA